MVRQTHEIITCDSCGKQVEKAHRSSLARDSGDYCDDCITRVGGLIIPNSEVPVNIPKKDIDRMFSGFVHDEHYRYDLDFSLLRNCKPEQWILVLVPHEDGETIRVMDSYKEASVQLKSWATEGSHNEEDEYVIYNNGTFYDWEIGVVLYPVKYLNQD